MCLLVVISGPGRRLASASVEEPSVQDVSNVLRDYDDESFSSFARALQKEIVIKQLRDKPLSGCFPGPHLCKVMTFPTK
jgi:hypothetical protein